jgi:hypothetical protein
MERPAVDRSLVMLRDHLEHLLQQEDELQCSLARKRGEPDPPTIQLLPELIRRRVQSPNRPRSGPRKTADKPEWIYTQLLRARKRREDAERRFLRAARKADQQSTAGAPLTATRTSAPIGRAGVPAWVVGVIVVLAVLVNVGSSDSDSVLLPILGLVVAVIGLVPTTISAYFDFRTHQRRNEDRAGTDRQ